MSSAEADQIVSRNVRLLRAVRHWTQGELAKRAGIGPATVAAIESGRPWKGGTVCRLAVAFQLPAMRLLDPALFDGDGLKK